MCAQVTSGEIEKMSYFRPMVLKVLKESWRFALWMIVIGIILTFFMVRAERWFTPVYWKVTSFTVLMWFFLWIGNAYTSDLVSLKISWTHEPLKRFVVGMAVMIGYTMGLVYGLILIFRWTVDLNLGDTAGMIYGSLIVTFVISTFMHGRGFLQNWKEAAIDAEKSKKESIKAQYESLKNQVNPHFLFNSLNALTNLVYQDQDKAAKFIKQLSEVYRYVLDTRDKEVVPIDEEVKFLKSYLYLQQIRFGDKLKVDMALDSIQGMIAPLALQMLVENAIKHNVISEELPLAIKIFVSAGKIVVENTLQKKSILPEDSPGLGLENIRRRYEFLSNQKVEVVADTTSFRVYIPLIK